MDKTIGLDRVEILKNGITEFEDGFELDAVFCREMVKDYRGKKEYMPLKEIEKALDTLRGVPTTVEHVNLDKDEENRGMVLDFSEIRGFVMPASVHLDGDKARGKIWLDRNTENEELVREIRDGERADLSVTFGYMPLEKPGKFNGVKYDVMQKDIVFFSVAHTVAGRCSFKDGCGVRSDSLNLDNVIVDAWEVKEHYIYARIKDPGLFVPKSFRWITLSEEKGIHAIIGNTHENKTEIQAYRFEKLRWNLEKAKGWVNSHQKKNDSKEGANSMEKDEIKSMCLDSLAELNPQVRRLKEQCDSLCSENKDLKTKLDENEAQKKELEEKMQKFEEAEKTRIEGQRTSLISEIEKLDPDSRTFAEALELPQLQQYAERVKAFKGDSEEQKKKKEGDSDPKEEHTGGGTGADSDNSLTIGYWNQEKGVWER